MKFACHLIPLSLLLLFTPANLLADECSSMEKQLRKAEKQLDKFQKKETKKTAQSEKKTVTRVKVLARFDAKIETTATRISGVTEDIGELQAECTQAPESCNQSAIDRLTAKKEKLEAKHTKLGERKQDKDERFGIILEKIAAAIINFQEKIAEKLTEVSELETNIASTCTAAPLSPNAPGLGS